MYSCLRHIYTKINESTCKLVRNCYGVSDELLNWLKDSCIKTKSGEDLVCFHGSPSHDKFAVFNDSCGYGCKSFVGFFSLDRDFAECYSDDGEDTDLSRVRSFAINSKKLFDIKNPACIRFLRAQLPDNIICQGDILDKASFIDYLRTGKLLVSGRKIDISKFNNIKMLDKIGMDILGNSGWEHSCTLADDKQLQNKHFLNILPETNSILVLDHGNILKPAIDRSYWNKDTEGIYLSGLQVHFSKALAADMITANHLNKLANGQPVNIKISAEEFISVCDYSYSKVTESDRQKLNDIIHNPTYNNLDLSVDVMLVPQKIDLDEFNKGYAGEQKLENADITWEIYEDSHCIMDNQKIHILDWLKNAGFDAVIVKECWAVNIICLYKNMIKDLNNRMPTNSDNVFENYHYSDALLTDLF